MKSRWKSKVDEELGEVIIEQINGVKYYAQEASYSMHTLAQYYLKYKEDFNLNDEIILALGEF